MQSRKHRSKRPPCSLPVMYLSEFISGYPSNFPGHLSQPIVLWITLKLRLYIVLPQAREDLAKSKASNEALTQQAHEHHSKSLQLAATVMHLTQSHSDETRKLKAKLAWLDTQRRAKLIQRSSLAILKERVSQSKKYVRALGLLRLSLWFR